VAGFASRAALWPLLLAGAIGCGADPAPTSPPSTTPPVTVQQPPGDTVVPAGFQGLRSGQLLRLYKVHLPDPRPAGRLPLLLALHGYSDNPENFEATTGFDAIADREGFVVAYPKGYLNMWNAGGPYEQWSYGTDDLAFISALIDTLAAHYPIDPARVFVTGHSNGAYMTYRVARSLWNKVAAIAPLEGSELRITYPVPLVEVAIVHVHALDDTTVPFSGKSGDIATLPVDSVLLFWANHNLCNPRPDTFLNRGGVLGRRWHSPSERGDVVLYTTPVGGHT
jgi:polyhydroxybutyrate depolymerase